MDYTIKINEFEGPMDLLLHLVKKADIDIALVNVKDIIDQYLNYIEAMQEMNLDIASEYLIYAAELMEIKSSFLLPKKQEIIEEEEEDPKQKLIRQLLEYKKYKELTTNFKEMEEERKQIYTKLPENLKEYQIEEKKINFGEIGLDDLLAAFNNFLKRKQDEKPIHTKITKKEYSVSIRSKEIKNILKTKKRVDFEELFEIVTKEYVVVTFLSILDLAKKNELVIEQENNFSKIILSLRGSE